uniref:Vesicle transport protein n=1 Tax=Haemonchus placei TaxID=6290 RepID=A0A0N4X742_HAEPC
LAGVSIFFGSLVTFVLFPQLLKNLMLLFICFGWGRCSSCFRFS